MLVVLPSELRRQWSRIALPLDEIPGRASDTELASAVLGHDYIEPDHWRAPNVLVLERHEYYEKVEPLISDGVKFESIVGLSRCIESRRRSTPRER